MNEMLGNVNTSSALSAFEKMEEKGKKILIGITFWVLGMGIRA